MPKYEITSAFFPNKHACPRVFFFQENRLIINDFQRKTLTLLLHFSLLSTLLFPNLDGMSKDQCENIKLALRNLRVIGRFG